MLAFACAGLFAITAGAAPAGVTATPKVAPLSPTPGAYLTFSSAGTFTVTPSAVSWNGALFYSTNTTDWIAFDRDGATAALDSGSGEYRLYFRGTNNTLITGGAGGIGQGLGGGPQMARGTEGDEQGGQAVGHAVYEPMGRGV